jgi:sarcosine oxidase
VLVVGAGVFGAWTAWQLARRGQKVLLVDAYGPGNSRASSGGESRIIRMGYGADELYTRWAMRSLVQWKELFSETARSPVLFHETGVLWLGSKNYARLSEMTEVLTRCKVPFESLTSSAIAQRYLQFSSHDLGVGILETESGVLMGRRAVAAVVERALGLGVEYRQAHVAPPNATATRNSSLDAISTSDGERISAGQFVFACGAWLGKIFPKILGPRIFPSRQEVFFFGVPPGDSQFSARSLPTWLMKCTACRTWNRADSRLLSTVTAKALIRTRRRVWCRRNPSSGCASTWQSASQPWRTRRSLRRACANTKTLRTVIF